MYIGRNNDARGIGKQNQEGQINRHSKHITYNKEYNVKKPTILLARV